MHIMDYGILGILLISVLISLIRGFTKEAMSLVTWGLAIWTAMTFCADLSLLSPALSKLLASYVDNPLLRMGITFVVLFFVILMIGGVINFLIGRLINSSGLGGTDRVLGVCFGLLRGILCVVGLVMVMGFMQLEDTPWWKDSKLLPQFQVLAEWTGEAFDLDSREWSTLTSVQE